MGTWQLTGDDCRRAVADALALGYRHVDTAEMYDNEEEVGRGLRDARVPREEVFLTTKVWRDHLRRRDVARALDGSLKRLGTDYVDLLLVHWPNPDIELAETLDAFREAREKKKTRLIGVSNFPAWLLREALALAPELANDQVEYHPFLGQEPLLAVVRERGLFLTAYSPIARGAVTQDAAIQAVAATRGVSTAQVALAWLLGQDRVAAVPKATGRAHLADNLAALDLVLTDDERAALDALPKDRRRVSPGFAPDWAA